MIGLAYLPSANASSHWQYLLTAKRKNKMDIATIAAAATLTLQFSQPVSVPEIANCQQREGETVIEVGPEKQYQELHDVPMERIPDNTLLRIHPRSSPYRSVLYIGGNVSGLRICGVRAPDGQRPVISGQNAKWRAGAHINLQWWADLGLIVVNRYSTEWTQFPERVTVEGLTLEGAKHGNTFTDPSGATRNWAKGSACFYALRGHDIVLRDNEIRDCGFGVFTKSQGANFEQIHRITLEGNYIYRNNANSEPGVHNVYVQAFDALYQFNYFGAPVKGPSGSNVKDRSAGMVFRYNFVDTATGYNLDLVEAEEHRETALDDPEYGQDLVYGNIFRQTDNARVLHYGGDHLEAPQYQRAGNLFFYHNTVAITVKEAMPDAALGWLRFTTVEESAHMFNNIIRVTGTVGRNWLMTFNDPAPGIELGGTVYWGRNWVPPNWGRDQRAKRSDMIATGMILGEDGELGIMRGSENLLTQGYPIVGYFPTPITRDAAESIQGLGLLTEAHSPKFQYNVGFGDVKTPLTRWRPRVQKGTGMALGAVEEQTSFQP
jgi:hypothetical protein